MNARMASICFYNISSHPGSKSSFIRTEHLPNMKMKEWKPNGPNHSGNQSIAQDTPVLLAEPPVWSGHLRRLFFGSLYIPCSSSACFTYTYSRDWPSHACPRARLITLLALDQNPPQSLSKGEVRGMTLCSFLVTDGHPEHQFPYNNLPPCSLLPPGVKSTTIACSNMGLNWWMSFQDFLHK